MGPGITRDVSVGAPPADQPAISDSGRFVAYQADLTGEETDRTVSGVFLRDVRSQRPVLVSPPSVDAVAPSLSADGQTLSYARSESGVTDIDVVDARHPARPVRRRITDRHDDLPFQRTPSCVPIAATQVDTTLGGCGPVLSGDGRSVAIPAELSVVSPALEPLVRGQAGAPYLDPASRHGLALVDFDAPVGLGGAAASDVRLLTIRVSGPRPVRFDDVEVDGDPAFTALAPAHAILPACEGTSVDPGETCLVGVRFNGEQGACGTPAYGDLSITGPTPSSQLMVALAATHGCPTTLDGSRSSSHLEAADCPATGPMTRVGAVLPDPGGEWSATVLGEAELGSTVVTAQRLDNTAGPQVLHFRSTDCAVQLIQPPGAANACVDGQWLDATCTAFVAFRPSAVHTAVASIDLYGEHGDLERTVRVVGAGMQSVVVVRRTARGGTDFTARRAPGARLASISEAGVPVAGTAPSLSYDGRYLAFVTGSGAARDASLRAQVLVHDTDADGDRSWRSGATTNVSLANADERVGLAVQPSISGDGQRVAFVELVKKGSCDCSVYGARILVRDLHAGFSRVITAPSTSEADPTSVAPSLSRDGSTVAFASDDPAYLPPDVTTEGLPQVYVQGLPDDLGDDLTPPAIVSLDAADSNVGWAGSAALNADGGIAAFASSAPLTDPGDACCGDGSREVYARTRYGTPRLSTDSLLFALPVPGFAGDTQFVTIANDGPGPVRVTSSIKGRFRLVEGCPAAVHPGDVCRFALQHVPRSDADADPGPADASEVARKPSNGVRRIGTLQVRFTRVEDSDRSVRIPLQLWQDSLDPSALDFPDVLVGTESSAQTISVVNNFDEPVMIAALPLANRATPSPSPQGPSFVPVDDDVFTVDTEGDGGRCGLVDPGDTCEIEVTYTPDRLFEQRRWLAIGTPTTYPPFWRAVQYVQLTGSPQEPTLATSPSVAREGKVVFVTGTGFLPGQPVSLGWAGGPVSVPEIVPDATGTFTAPVVVVAGRPGTYDLEVTMPGVGTVKAAPVLVVPGSLQPPDFTGRN